MGITRNLNLDAHRRRVAKMTLEIGADGVRPIGGGESVQMPLYIPNDAGWTGASVTSVATATACTGTKTFRSRDPIAAAKRSPGSHSVRTSPPPAGAPAYPAPAPPIDRAGAHAYSSTQLSATPVGGHLYGDPPGPSLWGVFPFESSGIH